MCYVRLSGQGKKMSLASLFILDDSEKLRDLLFDFDGRINRKEYWQAWLIFSVISIIMLLPILVISSFLPYLAICLAIIALILMLNASIAICCKRLHDRDKSGWWLLLFYIGPGLLEATGKLTGPMIANVSGLASLALFVWATIELGCLRGTSGPNKYGPDPLAASSGQTAPA